MSTPRIAVVVTGRDREGSLSRCLRVARAADWRDLPFELLYATDAPSGAEAAIAARAGARIAVADAATTGAARNAGWQASQADAVLFLGADTLVDRGFPKQALAALADTGTAAVRGQCREALPLQSPYAEVVDLDGVMPAGDALDGLGDALFRRSALEEAGGFDARLDAGATAELCRRLVARRWRLVELAQPMARHDDTLAGFGDYWRRAVRIGEAYAAAEARSPGQAAFPYGDAPQRNRAHGGLRAGCTRHAGRARHPEAGAKRLARPAPRGRLASCRALCAACAPATHSDSLWPIRLPSPPCPCVRATCFPYSCPERAVSPAVGQPHRNPP